MCENKPLRKYASDVYEYYNIILFKINVIYRNYFKLINEAIIQ